MQEVEQVASPEHDAQESEALEAQGQTVATDTAETVAETDEQKNQRVAAEQAAKAEKRQNNFARRAAELTAEKYAAQRQVEQLTAILQQTLQGRAQPQQQPQGAPTRDQFADYETYLEARATYAAEQRADRLFEARQAETQQRTQQQQYAQQAQQVRTQFESRMQEFASKNADWDDAVAQNHDVNVPDEAAGLIHMDPDGPAILYAIGKNPALAAQLHGRNVVQQAMVLGQIKATLKASPQVSKAPSPGRPVGSRGGPLDNGPNDSDSMDAWLKKRNAQLRG